LRPKITLKLATSLDGKIALANGNSQWVTSEEARAHGRYLRAENDAIAVGAVTAELDNPHLTSRVPGLKDPVRIVFDTTLKLGLLHGCLREMGRRRRLTCCGNTPLLFMKSRMQMG